MYLKRFKIIVVIILIVSMILGFVIVFPKNRTSLQSVVYSACGSDDTTYLIEQKEDYFKIYHVDKNGVLLGSIEQPKITNDYYYWLVNLKYFDDNAYLVVYQNETASTEGVKQNVYMCDFKNGTLNKLTDLENHIDSLDYIINNEAINVRYTYYNAENQEYFLKSGYILEKFNKNNLENISDINGGIAHKNVILDSYENVYFQNDSLELLKVTGYNEYEKLYPIDDTVARITEISYDGKDNLYFIDSISNKLMCYNVKEKYFTDITENINKAFDTYNAQNFTNYSISDLRNISFNLEGDFTASIDALTEDENNYILFRFFNDSFTIIDTIDNNLGIGKNILYILGYGILIFIILSLIVFLIYIFLFRYISLVVRMLTAFIILMSGIVLIIFNGMKFYLSDAYNNFSNDKLLYVSQNRLHKLVEIPNDYVETILQTDFNGSDYQNWSDIQNSIYSFVDFYSTDINSVQEYSNGKIFENPIQINNIYVCSLYMIDKNNDIILVYDSSYRTGIPVEYVKNRHIYNIMQEVISTGEKILVSDLHLMQESTSIYCPIFSCEGNIIGIMEVNAINNSETSFKVSEIIIETILEVIIIIAILLTIILIILFNFLKPLKELKNKIIQLSNKNIGVTITPVGNNEITELSVQFNKMSTQLAENISNMKLLNQYYEYYVPVQVCKIFQKPSISSIKLNDVNRLSLTILRIKVFINNTDIENHVFINVLNQFLEKIVSVIENYGGFIEYFNRHEIKVLYLENYGNSVRTAIAISEIINQMQINNNPNNICVKMLLSYDNCTFKIIGNNNRISIDTYSPNEITLKHLESIYDSCNLIVTDTLVNQLSKFFEIFDTRFIGIFNLNGKNIKLYEVFNGDNLYNKNLKRIYKDSFEKAVYLYLLKDYRMARNIFAEIFEKYPEDYLSKNYIYLCDNMLKQGGESL